jgi:hypothetical protein
MLLRGISLRVLSPGASLPGPQLLAALGLGLSALACNVAIGGGVVAVAGGAGILAAQCYDQVRIRVKDQQGRRSCDARVSLTQDGSQRTLRPCYHASLTEGRYRLDVRQAGYLPAEMEFAIPEHPGKCPHYTHTIELTLRRPGEPPATPVFTPSRPPAAAEASRPRPPVTLPPPIPVAAPVVAPAPVPALPVTPAPAAAPAVAPEPAPVPPAAPPSAAFPPAPSAPPAPAAPRAP